MLDPGTGSAFMLFSGMAAGTTTIDKFSLSSREPAAARVTGARARARAPRGQAGARACLPCPPCPPPARAPWPLRSGPRPHAPVRPPARAPPRAAATSLTTVLSAATWDGYDFANPSSYP